MGLIVNQLSYIMVSLLILVGAGVLMYVRKINRGAVILVLSGLAFLLVSVWLVIRPDPGLESAGQIQEQIGAGVPVLLEVQSEY
jgi:uncharacterized protein (DUF58 family)